jgi:N-methylhydantoinase A/acetophenone carboxylase
MNYTIDIDTGGTFTDGFFVSEKDIQTVKVLTTPHDLTVCFKDCIKAGAERFGVKVEDLLYNASVIRFSNTIGTNTIIQKDGAKVGLLVSQGQESEVQKICDTVPILSKEMILGIKGHIDEAGVPKEGLDAEEVLSKAQTLIDSGARCLAVSLKNSVFNPVHERRVKQLIKEEYPRHFLGSVPVFLSSEVTDRPGENERTNAVLINAYIHNKLARLLYRAAEDLRGMLYQWPLLIVHSNGGAARVAKTRAINTYNSGPAAGLLGASFIGSLYNHPDTISTDMGGTSFDIGAVQGGVPKYTLAPNIEGLPINLPMIDIKAMGSGGGSIAHIKNGTLLVGPQSAGALPGPACFDLGGIEPTITDADVILGFIDPNYFLGGRMKLNQKKAATAIQGIASQLGTTIEGAAVAIRKKAAENMGRMVRGIIESVGEKFNPVLVVYGGAGPTHCCDFASIAKLKKIITTPFASVFSAYSSSTLDVNHMYSRFVGMLIGEKVELGAVQQAVDQMMKEALKDMRGEGFSEDKVKFFLEFFLSDGSGGPEVKAKAKGLGLSGKDVNELCSLLEKEYRALGHGKPKECFLTTVNLQATAVISHPLIPQHPPAGKDPKAALKGTRKVFFDKESGWTEVPVFDRDRLRNGNEVQGPAIIEAPDTTYVIPAKWVCRVDHYLNGIIEEVS